VRPCVAGISVIAALILSVLPTRLPVAGADPLPRVRIEARAGSTLLVHGTYPRVESRCIDPVRPVLHSRFRGAIEVGRDVDGSLFVIGDLPFESYLKGIAEVPRSWPQEALKAQVVAARSYALSRLEFQDETARHFGYDLCATDACQVYRGVGVEAGPWGDRWVRAVNATRGEVLLYQGRPAQTFYFSTSNGHTFSNAQGFGGAPLPYLRSVPERDDGASPLSNWSVRMPLSHVSRFLRDAGLWSGRAITRVIQQGDRVVISGGRRTVETSRSDFRTTLNSSAPCLDPSGYPSGDLPQTIPSRWFSVSSNGRFLRVKGRGWGHGVGMVQWGAYGKALRGLGYADILAYYYGGLRPEPYPEPRTIRVGIATGLRSVTIDPSGPVDASDLRITQGPWRFTGGRNLHVRGAGSVEPVLSVTGFRIEPRGEPGDVILGSLELERPASARLVLLTENEEIPLSPFKPFPSGQAELRGRLPRLEPGAYGIAAVVSDGIDEIHTGSRPIRVTVSGGSSQSPAPSNRAKGEPPGADEEDSGARTAALVAVAALMAVAASALVLTRRRRHHSS